MAASSTNKPHSPWTQKNPLETLTDFGSSVAKNTGDSFGQIGSGIFDQMFGNYPAEQNKPWEQNNPQEKKNTPFKKPEMKTLFSFQQEQEVRTIKELMEQIRQEIKALKQADKALLSEVKDIEKISMESVPENIGIYHVRFLEVVLKILRSHRAKVGESRTWMQAMVSRKKARGSLFAARSKKQGTAYSMSQELSNARSIQ